MRMGETPPKRQCCTSPCSTLTHHTHSTHQHCCKPVATVVISALVSKVVVVWLVMLPILVHGTQTKQTARVHTHSAGSATGRRRRLMLLWLQHVVRQQQQLPVQVAACSKLVNSLQLHHVQSMLCRFPCQPCCLHPCRPCQATRLQLHTRTGTAAALEQIACKSFHPSPTALTPAPTRPATHHIMQHLHALCITCGQHGPCSHPVLESPDYLILGPLKKHATAGPNLGRLVLACKDEARQGPLYDTSDAGTSCVTVYTGTHRQ